MDDTITLTITLEQAGVLTKSVGKTLASEQSKIQRHGPNHQISRQAARDWQLLDEIDSQLREGMADRMSAIG